MSYGLRVTSYIAGMRGVIGFAFFYHKGRKGFSQRAQNVAKQYILFVCLCVYLVLFVVKKASALDCFATLAMTGCNLIRNH